MHSKEQAEEQGRYLLKLYAGTPFDYYVKQSAFSGKWLVFLTLNLNKWKYNNV
jgi:hypothetical protein